MSTEKNFYNFYYNDDLPVHLLTCGYVTWTEDYYYGPTTRYDYIIHYINQGVMHFTLNGKKYDAINLSMGYKISFEDLSKEFKKAAPKKVVKFQAISN